MNLQIVEQSLKERAFTWIIRVIHKLGRADFTISVKGRKYKIPLINGKGACHLFPAEPWMGGLIGALFKVKPGAFIDVGVNLGQTMMTWNAYVGGQPYFGFEPNPFCAHYSSQLIQVNHFKNCTLLPFGLSDETKVTKLAHNYFADQDATLVPELRTKKYDKNSYVAVFKGDDVSEEIVLGTIGTIKIDVEGAELEVLRGFRDTLRRYRPFVVCEVLPCGNSTGDVNELRVQRKSAVERILKELNYKISHITEDGELQQVNTIPIRQQSALWNYLFIPNEFHAAIKSAIVSEL